MYEHRFRHAVSRGSLWHVAAPGFAQKLALAVDLIVRTQNDEGGWRYQPRKAGEADISVTICQVMALRAAQRRPVCAERDHRPLHRLCEERPDRRRRISCT